jgi:hypothetical protein
MSNQTLSSKQVKKETVVFSEITGWRNYSNSSYIVVQEELLLAEMTDHINEMVIYKEPSEIEISVDPVRDKCLLAISEETSSLIEDEKRDLKKKPTGHSFEVLRTFKSSPLSKKVSLNQPFHLKFDFTIFGFN